MLGIIKKKTGTRNETHVVERSEFPVYDGNAIMSEGLVLQDADACPMVGIVESLAEKYNISATLLCDINHVLYSDYSEVIVVGTGALMQ